MKKVSVFASKNPLSAQILIALCHVLLLLLSIQLASLLDSNQNFASGKWLGFAVCIFIFNTVIFRNHQSYARKRVAYFICGLSLFTITTCLQQKANTLRYNTYTSVNGSFIVPVEKKTSTTKEKKQLRAAVKELRKAMKDSKGNTGKVFATIGVILGAVALTLVIAALGCSLACNGAGALAAILVVGGLVGVILLAGWAIKKINRKKSEEAVPKKVD